MNEGSAATISFSNQLDPSSADTSAGFHYAFSCTNDSLAGATYARSGPSASTTCVFADNGSYTVSGRILDKNGGFSDYATSGMVNNVPPTITATGSSITENDVATISGTITDPGTMDTFALTVDWRDGAPTTYSFPAGTTSYTVSHQYLDDNPSGTSTDAYVVTVGVTDKDGGAGAAVATVLVANADPVASIESVTDELGSAVGAGAPVVLARQAVRLTAGVSDRGTRDTHTGTVVWGDRSNTDLGALSGPASASHRFAAPGTYRIAVTVVDDDTRRNTAGQEIEVVDAAGAISRAADMIRGARTSSADARRELDRALGAAVGNNHGDASNGALDSLLKGNRHTALGKLEHVVEALNEAAQVDRRLDLTAILRLVGLTAKAIATDAIDEAAAAGPSDTRLSSARALVATGNVRLVAGDFAAAVATYRDAVRAL